MPRYNKKITSLMDYKKFKEAIAELPPMKQAFLSVLFFAGCRVSEALALKGSDISYTGDTIAVQFFRLKGSKQTDPQEFPRSEFLNWLCEREGQLFPFKYITAYRLVKKIFPDLYPHYFRMNRITKTDILFGDATVYHVFGISATSIDHYRGKVDIKRVSKAMIEEVLQVEGVQEGDTLVLPQTPAARPTRHCVSCGADITNLEKWKYQCRECYLKQTNPGYQGKDKPLRGSPQDLRNREAERLRRIQNA